MRTPRMPVVLISIFLLAALGCGERQPAAAPPTKVAADQLKVAFVYVGPVGDAGWTYAHDQGRKAILARYPKIKTSVAESVKEGAEATRRIEQFARDGYQLIFTTSYGFMDPTLEVARRHPNVRFLHCSGNKRAPNVGTYFGRMYQPKYLTGLIAGKLTRSNKIGYVAPFPIPEVIRHINAVAVGLREVNPRAVIKVVWINTWFDPAKEKDAANSLLDAGCDIICTGADSPAPMQAAQARGKLAFGYDSDNRKAAPKAFLTAPVWDWGVVYNDIVGKLIDGKLPADLSGLDYWGGLESGVVKLAPMSDLVPAAVRKLVEQRSAEIAKGSRKIFGKTSDADLLKMSRFVEGVEGKIPARK